LPREAEGSKKAIVPDSLIINSNWTLLIVFNKPYVPIVRVFYLYFCFTVQHFKILKHLQVLIDLNLLLESRERKKAPENDTVRFQIQKSAFVM
jgi:hypothetical protein